MDQQQTSDLSSPEFTEVLSSLRKWQGELDKYIAALTRAEPRLQFETGKELQQSWNQTLVIIGNWIQKRRHHFMHPFSLPMLGSAFGRQTDRTTHHFGDSAAPKEDEITILRRTFMQLQRLGKALPDLQQSLVIYEGTAFIKIASELSIKLEILVGDLRASMELVRAKHATFKE